MAGNTTATAYREVIMPKRSVPIARVSGSPLPTDRNSLERTSDISASLDDVRVVYQAAMAAYTYEGAQIWSRFNAMLVAHSILLAVTGQLLLDPTNRYYVLAIALTAVGFLMSLLWLVITVRGFAYHDAFVTAAKKQEARLSASFLRDIRLQYSGWFSYIGWFRTRTATCCMIGVFALLYLGLGFYLLW
jgi:hypothetical protein